MTDYYAEEDDMEEGGQYSNEEYIESAKKWVNTYALVHHDHFGRAFDEKGLYNFFEERDLVVEILPLSLDSEGLVNLAILRVVTDEPIRKRKERLFSEHLDDVFYYLAIPVHYNPVKN
jgi:hypothetical protein